MNKQSKKISRQLNLETEIKSNNYGFFRRLWRGKKSREIQHWLIVAIAIIPLALVQQVSQSMIEGIAARIIETDSYHMVLRPYIDEYKNFSSESFRAVFKDKAKGIDGIKNTYVELRGLGIIRNKDEKTGIQLRGIEQDLLKDEGLIKYVRLIDGTLSVDGKGVILGEAVAKKINARIGSEIMILTTRLSKQGKAIPKITRVNVRGIITTGYEELDRSWVLSSIDLAKDIIAHEDQEWYVGIKIKDPFALSNGLVQRSKRESLDALKTYTQLEESYLKDGQLSTWYSANYSRYTLFTSTKQQLSLVMLVAVIIAVITLASTMSMTVIDLDIEIAVLKGIGANPRKLEGQVFLQGLRYGSIGAILGSAIGVFLSYGVNTIIYVLDGIINGIRYVFGYSNPISMLNPEYYLSEIPFHLYFKDLLVIILATIVLSTLSAWIPALKLRKISPLKIIRNHQ